MIDKPWTCRVSRNKQAAEATCKYVNEKMVIPEKGFVVQEDDWWAINFGARIRCYSSTVEKTSLCVSDFISGYEAGHETARLAALNLTFAWGTTAAKAARKQEVHHAG